MSLPEALAWIGPLLMLVMQQDGKSIGEVKKENVQLKIRVAQAKTALSELVEDKDFLTRLGGPFAEVGEVLRGDNKRKPLRERDVSPSENGVCAVGLWWCNLLNMTFQVNFKDTLGGVYQITGIFREDDTSRWKAVITGTSIGH